MRLIRSPSFSLMATYLVNVVAQWYLNKMYDESEYVRANAGEADAFYLNVSGASYVIMGKRNVEATPLYY